MDLLRTTFDQLRGLFMQMPLSGRLTLTVVTLMVVGALGTLIYSRSGASEEYLLGGKYFAPEELARNQEALRRAELTGFRIDGQRIAVPRRQLDQYTAAIALNGSLPADFSADYDRMLEKISPFTTESQRRDMMEEARKVKLSKILKAIPDIDDAFVEWDRLKQNSLFSRQQTVTAQVSVRAAGGRDLSPDLVRSLRFFVAGAVAGVASDNVTVVDLNSNRVYAPSREGQPEEDRVLALKKQRTIDYEQQIRSALDYITGVNVTVNVELENLRTTHERQQTVETKGFTASSNVRSRNVQSTQDPVRAEAGAVANRPQSVPFRTGNRRSDVVEEQQETGEFVPSFRQIERTIEGLQPKSVTVAITIPEEYYDSVALQSGLAAGTDEFKAKAAEVRKKTELEALSHVRTLLPIDTPSDAVKVASITRVDRKSAPVTASFVTTTIESLTPWAGVAGLALLALWALWTVNKSLSKLPPAPLPEMSSSASAAAAEEQEPSEPAPVTRRDELQTLVRDNPEMAASVLSRWIVSGKT